MDDFFPELIDEARHQERAQAAAVNTNQAAQLEQHAGNAVESWERIQAYMAQYEPHRLECELREMQKYFAHCGGDYWLQKHLVLVAKSRGREAALKLEDQFYNLQSTAGRGTF